MSIKLGHFDPFADRSSFNQRSRFRPESLYTHRTMRCTTTGRCRPRNFTANSRRTRRDLADEPDGGYTVLSPDFCDFSAITGQFRPPHSSYPPFLDPLNSFLWSLFVDSSLFESYDENKVGRWLDRVFQPPQRLLEQCNGTDKFLVSWAFH